MSPSSSDFHSQKYFNEALNFLREYEWIYNYPNTDILSKDIFNKIPSEWISYLSTLSFSDLKDLSLCKEKDGCPQSLVAFFNKIKSLNVPRNNNSSKFRDYNLNKNYGLCVKKQHEIVSLAPLVAHICEEMETTEVIDIGAGLGYLSHLLAEKHNFSVLGIEGCPEKIKLALKNQSKHHKTTAKNVTFHNHFITDKSADYINESIKNKLSDTKNVCMCGLHACADLSVTILELFLKIDQVKSLVIMPCCYHRLGLLKTEDGREFFKSFPVSEALKCEFGLHDASTFLRRPFLRLACQQTLISFLEMDEKQHEEHARNFLMRAVLQKAADEVGCNVLRLKRKSGKSLNLSDFSFYLKNFCNNYKLVPKAAGVGEKRMEDFNVESKIAELWDNNKDKLFLMEALTGLQSSIQSVCENILLQDRVQFLLENGVNCYIEKVTDDIISPRCHALVAIKQ